MISLKENRAALFNLGNTIKVLENIDTLIEYYSKETISTSHVEFTGLNGPGRIIVQFNKKFAIDALTAQRNELAESLAVLGIKVD
jgi:hypothetical protein